MYDVITVGSATVDVFVKTESDLIKFKTVHGEDDFIAYPTGSKILITDLQFMIGGGGTNTGVSFSRLGFKVGYVGKLGKDQNGKKVLDLLKKEKINYLGSFGKETSYSIILDSIEDDRTILTYRGSINTLKKKELDFKKFKTNWFYISSMMKDSFLTATEITKYAKKNNIKVAFNPSSYQAKKGAEYLKPIIENIEVLVLNKEEAKYLVGPFSNDSILKKLHDLGPKIVVVTDGRRGVYVYDGSYFYHANPNKKLKILETTGAGDAFASTFISGLIMKKKIPDCIKMGMINSESVITNYGAKNILLSKRKLLERLKKDKRKVFRTLLRQN